MKMRVARTEKLLDKIRRIDGGLNRRISKTGEVKWKIKTFYEGRILVNMAAFVMRQDDLKPLHGNLDWEKLFRVADYNKISNLIYLAILGNNEKIPERWKTRFMSATVIL